MKQRFILLMLTLLFLDVDLSWAQPDPVTGLTDQQMDEGLMQFLWHYRYWSVMFLLLTAAIGLFIFNRQLQKGIERKTGSLVRISSDYKDILDHMQDIYFRTSLQGEIIWISAACQSQLGHQRSKLLGCHLRELFVEPSDGDLVIDMLEGSEGQLPHFETCLINRDGERVWVEMNAQYHYNALSVKTAVEGNIRNISKRKHAELESEVLAEQLQQAQKMESIGVLAGGIAHDFNNLLVGVMGNAELALLDLQTNDDVEHYLEQIYNASRKGADLVSQMMAYAGKGRFSMGEQNLNELIDDVSSLLATVINKKVVLDKQLSLPLPNVHGDKNQLIQLLMNLLTNASESIAGERGQITLRTGVCELCEEDFSEMYLKSETDAGKFVFVEVRDTGCGMDEATQQRIFDPFFTTKEMGSGLGLAAMLGIVRSHDGTFSLQSSPANGSCFTVFLPAMADEAIEVKPQHIERPDMPSVLSGTALIVDDEAGVRDVASRFLQRQGMDIIVADNGCVAVEIFRRNLDEISFVLLDLTMPEMDGEETFLAMRAICPDVPVLLSSGFSADEVVERLTRQGLAGFIRKPFNRKQLIQLTGNLLNNR